MRVLHVDTARGWRGGQNQVLLTARGMAERGHAVLVACLAQGALLGRARTAGLDVEPLRFTGDLSPAALPGLRRAVRRFEPDAVQVHDPHGLFPAIVARRAGAGLFATRRVDFPLRGLASRLKYRACRRVIAVSRSIASVLRAGGLPETAIQVVYEGVEDRVALPGGRELLRQLGVPADATVVGNVAALTDHKDHATLLLAAARVVAREPRAVFVVAGDGERRAELEAQARALGLGERLLMLGFRDDLDRLIPAFDVFCLSSRLEGLGTSILDAMCFGRPVVATRAGGIPEAVVDGESGWLAGVADPEGLAQALLQALASPDERAARGAAGRRRFAERFTTARMIEETLAVIAG